MLAHVGTCGMGGCQSLGEPLAERMPKDVAGAGRALGGDLGRKIFLRFGGTFGAAEGNDMHWECVQRQGGCAEVWECWGRGGCGRVGVEGLWW